MKRRPPTFRAYRAALLAYMLGSGEAGLADAYEFGRSSLNGGCSLMHILEVHERALDTILASTPAGDEVRRRVSASAAFLAEALSPFEMAFRGYRELLQGI